jgi:hypothetical protein
MYTCTYHLYVYTCMYTQIYMYIYTHISIPKTRARAHTHTQAHTHYVHKHTHTHKYTCICIEYFQLHVLNAPATNISNPGYSKPPSVLLPHKQHPQTTPTNNTRTRHPYTTPTNRTAPTNTTPPQTETCNARTRSRWKEIWWEGRDTGGGGGGVT